MAIAKKERFKDEGVRVELKEIPANPFPPEKINYKGLKLTVLGKSNRENLYPPSIQEPGLIRAVADNKIGQFIYSSDTADIYDVLLYVNEVDRVVIQSIMTRLQP